MTEPRRLRELEEAARRYALGYLDSHPEGDPGVLSQGRRLGHDHLGEPLYFDRQGEPISFLEWGFLFEKLDYKVVAKTKTPGAEVSTVWLGMNHAWMPEAPLQIFETMVFSDKTTFNERWQRHFHEELGIQERYATEEQALAGHREVVNGLVALEDTLAEIEAKMDDADASKPADEDDDRDHDQHDDQDGQHLGRREGVPAERERKEREPEGDKPDGPRGPSSPAA